MINCEDYPVDTIFSSLPFEPNNTQITFSGCGALNPFQNDPEFNVFGVGSPLLVNGSIGYMMGPGTRNYIEKPNMMTIASFSKMQPEYLGAFKTSYGLEPICSIALPIPILNERIFNNLIRSDNDVKLNVLSLVGREKVAESTYGQVWKENYLMVFDSSACSNCDKCDVVDKCPTNAFILKNNMISAIDRTRCFNCGTCAWICPDAFKLDMKSIEFEGKNVPVVLRQSDRNGAIKLANELKTLILNGEFDLKKPTGSLDFAEHVK
jgi:putative methanogenesis marker 16 metalloprotein